MSRTIAAVPFAAGLRRAGGLSPMSRVLVAATGGGVASAGSAADDLGDRRCDDRARSVRHRPGAPPMSRAIGAAKTDGAASTVGRERRR